MIFFEFFSLNVGVMKKKSRKKSKKKKNSVNIGVRKKKNSENVGVGGFSEFFFLRMMCVCVFLITSCVNQDFTSQKKVTHQTKVTH